jgi:protein-tyrosine phosphatase
MRDVVRRAGLSASIEVDSAGTGDWHIGEPADPRSIAAAKKRGFDLTGRARQFRESDWKTFDYVIAMDRSNYDILLESAPDGGAAEKKLSLLRSFDPESPPNSDVPDPYYTRDGFDEVIDLCVAACELLLEHLRRAHGLSG